MSRAAVSALALLVICAAPAGGPGRAPAGPTRDQLAQIQAACDAHQPGCDPVALLGSYERKVLGRALASRHLAIDRAPWGKTLGRIHIVNYAVFGPDDGALRMLQRLPPHDPRDRDPARGPAPTPARCGSRPWSTRPRASSATPCSPRSRRWSRSSRGEPGTVDLLVVTRDVWSLRLNSNWEVQSGKFTVPDPVAVGEQLPGLAQADRAGLHDGSGRLLGRARPTSTRTWPARSSS